MAGPQQIVSHHSPGAVQSELMQGSRLLVQDDLPFIRCERPGIFRKNPVAGEIQLQVDHPVHRLLGVLRHFADNKHIRQHHLIGKNRGEGAFLVSPVILGIDHGDDAADSQVFAVMLSGQRHDQFAENEQARRFKDDPVRLVLDYLAAMEARSLDRAAAFLDAAFEMRFTGTPPMRRLEELVDWARGRYREIAKTIEGTEACQQGDVTIVYVHGTLAGVWPDGTTFSGVRFIDRFELRGGKLVRQDVWNDLGEARAT